MFPVGLLGNAVQHGKGHFNILHVVAADADINILRVIDGRGPPHRYLHSVAFLEGIQGAHQSFRVVDHLSVHIDDDVAGLQAGLFRGAAFQP